MRRIDLGAQQNRAALGFSLLCASVVATMTSQPAQGGVVIQGAQFSNPDVDVLEATRQLTVSDSSLGPSERPAHDASAGDVGRWFFNHPDVPHVLHGKVLAATPEWRDPGVVTRCKVEVVQDLKGKAAGTIEVLSWGGQFEDKSTIHDHLPRCAAGEEFVAPVFNIGGELWLVGSERFYAIITTAGGESRTWGQAALAFFQSLRGAQ